MPEDKQTETAKLPRTELERLICFSPTVHYIATASGDYAATYISPGIKRQLGYEPAQFTQDSEFWANHIHPDDRQRVFSDLEQLFDDDRHAHEYRFQHADGSYRWMHDELALVLDKGGNPLEIIGSWLDVTTRKEAEFALTERNKQLEESKRQLEYLALYDQLTGLGNRNLFLKRLEHLIAAAGRKKEEVALLAMDLNGFKEVNDRLGHAAGDAVLREFGARLSESLGQVDQTYRIGGDEFAVLLEPRRDSLDSALTEAEKIARRLEAPIEIEGNGYSVGVSIGVAVFPQHGEDWTTVLRKADAAMYEAKKTDQVVAGASDVGATAILERLHLET
jgi:diguanylate cyclase (GGDEF)-like protein/PAS domain S-box-containing protein